MDNPKAEILLPLDGHLMKHIMYGTPLPVIAKWISYAKLDEAKTIIQSSPSPTYMQIFLSPSEEDRLGWLKIQIFDQPEGGHYGIQSDERASYSRDSAFS